MTEQELDAAIQKAAQEGARQALKEVGLCDGEAYDDVKELRGLLDSWRAKTNYRTHNSPNAYNSRIDCTGNWYIYGMGRRLNAHLVKRNVRKISRLFSSC